jgi:hypothetical protein
LAWRIFVSLYLGRKRVLYFSFLYGIATTTNHGHPEMSSTDVIEYPMGSTYHPEEQKLPLTVEDLQIFQFSPNNLGDKPTKKVGKNFIIYPIK